MTKNNVFDGVIGNQFLKNLLLATEAHINRNCFEKHFGDFENSWLLKNRWLFKILDYLKTVKTLGVFWEESVVECHFC